MGQIQGKAVYYNEIGIRGCQTGTGLYYTMYFIEFEGELFLLVTAHCLTLLSLLFCFNANCVTDPSFLLPLIEERHFP